MEYYLSVQYEMLLVASTWFNLENSDFSEISQIEKDKHFVITYLCNLKNKQMYIAKRNRLKDIENKTVVTNGKRDGRRGKWSGRLRDTNNCV